MNAFAGLLLAFPASIGALYLALGPPDHPIPRGAVLVWLLFVVVWAVLALAEEASE